MEFAVKKGWWCLLFSVQTALGFVPSVEGLFRNGANPPLSGNLVVVKGLIEKAAEVGEELARNVPPPSWAREALHVKLIFSGQSKERVQLLQVLYQNGRMDTRDLLHVRYFTWMERAVIANFSLDQSLFYGALATLCLNQASVMMAYLKQKFPDLKSNRERINRDKQRLLKRYQDYLQAIKKDKSLREEMDNPLSPKRPEEQKRVAEIMGAPFLQGQSVVSLQREGEDYFWAISQEGFRARFDNQTHWPVHMSADAASGRMELYFDAPVTLNGRHQLPQYIFVQTSVGQIYRVRMTSLQHLNTSRRSKSMQQRAADYRKALASVRRRSNTFLRPKFLSY